jgi:hypothetical protein
MSGSYCSRELSRKLYAGVAGDGDESMLDVESLEEDESRERVGGESAEESEDSLAYLGCRRRLGLSPLCGE